MDEQQRALKFTRQQLANQSRRVSERYIAEAREALDKVAAAFRRGHAATGRLEEALYWCSVQALRALHVVKATPKEKGAMYG